MTGPARLFLVAFLFALSSTAIHSQGWEHLGKVDGKWLAVPATVGSQIKGPCSRIDLMKKFAGIDVQEMYPAGSPAKADNCPATRSTRPSRGCGIRRPASA